MKKIIALAATAVLVSFSAASQAAEHCPELKKIEEVSNGVYRADGKGGEWTGVLQGIVANRTQVQSFKMALAIQENASAPIKFQHCTYGVGPDKNLDMRFIAKNEKEFSIQTEGDIWKTEDGPFGLIYNVCEKSSPENCKFTVYQ